MSHNTCCLIIPAPRRSQTYGARQLLSSILGRVEMAFYAMNSNALLLPVTMIRHENRMIPIPGTCLYICATTIVIFGQPSCTVYTCTTIIFTCNLMMHPFSNFVALQQMLPQVNYFQNSNRSRHFFFNGISELYRIPYPILISI